MKKYILLVGFIVSTLSSATFAAEGELVMTQFRVSGENVEELEMRCNDFLEATRDYAFNIAKFMGSNLSESTNQGLKRALNAEANGLKVNTLPVDNGGTDNPKEALCIVEQSRLTLRNRN